MKKFTAKVVREIQVEIEVPDDFSLIENDDENNESVDEFIDKVYAAVPDGIVRKQSITAWSETGAQIL